MMTRRRLFGFLAAAPIAATTARAAAPAMVRAGPWRYVRSWWARRSPPRGWGVSPETARRIRRVIEESGR